MFGYKIRYVWLHIHHDAALVIRCSAIESSFIVTELIASDMAPKQNTWGLLNTPAYQQIGAWKPPKTTRRNTRLALPNAGPTSNSEINSLTYGGGSGWLAWRQFCCACGLELTPSYHVYANTLFVTLDYLERKHGTKHAKLTRCKRFGCLRAFQPSL